MLDIQPIDYNLQMMTPEQIKKKKKIKYSTQQVANY